MRRSKHPARSRICVLLIDADEMSSDLLRHALERGRSGFTVQTIVGTSREAVEKLHSSNADVVVVSADLYDGPDTGFVVLRELRRFRANAPAIMLFRSRTADGIIEAMRLGARGICYRHQFCSELADVIRAVCKGEIRITNDDLDILLKVLVHFRPPLFNTKVCLTQREKEVIRLVVEGMKNREIANMLNITEHSVRNHVYRIFDKIGISSRAELILYAYAHRDQQN